MKNFTLAAITATACSAINLQALVEETKEATEGLRVYFDEDTRQWMEHSIEPATTPPSFDHTHNRWIYTDAEGNQVFVAHADAPPVPTFDKGACEWKDKVSGLSFIEAVGMDSTKMPVSYGAKIWYDQ